MATTPNLGLNKPAKGDTGWWSALNANQDVLDALFSNDQKTLVLSGTAQPRLYLVKTTAGIGEVAMRPFNGTVAGEADWRLLWADNLGTGGLTVNSFQIWRGGVRRLWIGGDGQVTFFGDSGGEKEIVYFTPLFGANETAMLLLTYDGVTAVLKRVHQGPPDSAGPGYRTLRVPN